MVTFLVGSFLVKIGAAPFYYWVPDVYEGCGRMTLIVLSIVSKIVVFFVLAKMLYCFLADYVSI
jgi:NADH:ubiquinone oxidoreductase subunit 2 (subunit N)